MTHITTNCPARQLPKGWTGNKDFVYCGRPSLFGNPFFLPRGAKPGSTVAKFKDYFLDRIARDPAFKNAVLKLRGKCLVCPGPTCTRDQCHTRVISDWINDQFAADNERLAQLSPDDYADLFMSDH